jgi:hypothetical protein
MGKTATSKPFRGAGEGEQDEAERGDVELAAAVLAVWDDRICADLGNRTRYCGPDEHANESEVPCANLINRDPFIRS